MFGIEPFGGVLAGLGQAAEAESLLRDSYNAISSDEGARPVYVEAAKKRLRDFYKATGRADEAAEVTGR